MFTSQSASDGLSQLETWDEAGDVMSYKKGPSEFTLIGVCLATRTSIIFHQPPNL